MVLYKSDEDTVSTATGSDDYHYQMEGVQQTETGHENFRLGDSQLKGSSIHLMSANPYNSIK